MGVLRAHCNHLLATGRLRSLITKAETVSPREQPERMPMQPQVRLSDDEKVALTNQYLEGRSTRYLAGVFGIHMRTVALIIKRQGIELRRRALADDQIREASRLVASGQTIASVARRMSIPESTLRCAVMRHKTAAGVTDSAALRPAGIVNPTSSRCAESLLRAP